ncbi:MAK10-like protein [Tanacetum coccineum]
MGDANPIRTLGDYFKPSHEGYMNTIELLVGNNVVTLRFNTIWLVQNECSFHGFWSEDPNQHLKDFLKLVDSLDLDGKNRERTLLRLFQFSLRDQASNWLEHLLAGSITTWEDLTTRFISQLFPPGRTAKLRNDILICLEYIRPPPHRALESSSLLDRSSSCSDTTYSSEQISSLCEICSDPHDTQYCMENPKQAFVDYASSRTDEAGGLMSNFMASQDARLSKFEADFKQQQSKMTNKIDTMLKAITDRMAGALPSNMVKSPKMNINSTTSVLSARSYPIDDPQCSTHIHGLINTITIHPKQQSYSHDNKPEENEEKEKISREDIDTNSSTPLNPSFSFITEKVLKFNSFFKSLGLTPQLSGTEVICTKGDDGDVMFIEIVKKNDNSRKEEPEAGGLVF